MLLALQGRREDVNVPIRLGQLADPSGSVDAILKGDKEDAHQ
jgi:hypothetical protein